MQSDLDRQFDECLAQVTAPGGPIAIGHDAQGRAIATSLPATLPAFFDAFCTRNGGTEALVCGEERLSFADLLEWADKLAPALVARGVRKGDRVALAMRNSSAWVVVYMAVLKAGGVATLLNGWWQAGEVGQALLLTSPTLVVADAPRAARIQQEGPWELVTLPVEERLAQALAPLLDGAGSTALPEIGPDDDATILFTSGSTGDAKGALSTHRAVVTGTYAFTSGLLTLLMILIKQGRPPANRPRTLVSVPFFHVTGEVPVLLNSFAVGRGMVIMDRWDAGEALRLIEKEKITYFVGVPTMSLELMNHPDRDRYDLSSLTDITAGGAPRPVAHVERLRQSFPNAQPALGYGLTETNAAGCINFWSSYAAKPASTGRAEKPFIEVAILGEGDRHLPPGEQGEIAIRSAANIKNYWNNPAATAAATTADHFIRTGDIGYLDADDYLFIVDRKKDIIIRGGENISCAEVEAALYECPAVAETSVFGVSDERLGEVPVAVVHVANGVSLDETALRAFLMPRVAAFKVPGRFIFTDASLPRLGTGKIDRVALKEQYAR